MAGAIRPTKQRRAGRAGPLSRKPIEVFLAEARAEGQSGPKPRFGFITLTLFGVGTMLGVGIFVVTAQVAADSAGPAVVLSLIIAAAVCACAALCYAELASMAPVAGGSAYVYAYISLGELAAFLIAWDLAVEYLFGAAAVAVGWSGYFDTLIQHLGLPIPAVISQAPFFIKGYSITGTGTLFNMPAAALVLLSGFIVWLGTSVFVRFSSTIIIIKLVIVLLVIGFGLSHVHLENWMPLVPAREMVNGTGRYGWAGVLTGVGLAFYAYMGFDMMSTAAQETRNPQRNVPAAIIAALAICTILYTLMSLTMTGLVSYKDLDRPAPIDVAIAAAGPALEWLRPLVSLSVTVGLASAVLAVLFSQSRLLYAMSRDGLLPRAFARLQPNSRTPTLGVVLSTLIASAFAAFVPMGLLGEFVSAGTLFGMAAVSASVIYLRISKPDAPRAFKTPVWPITTGVAFVSCLYFLATLGMPNLLRIGIWMGGGLAVYFLYSFRSGHGWSHDPFEDSATTKSSAPRPIEPAKICVREGYITEPAPADSKIWMP